MISAVILTKNEEENIERCLKSVSFCDEIIVVDDNSEDKTLSIAGKFGAKIYKRSMNKDFSTQSNFGMESSAGEWIFFVDADEVISPELQEEIKNTLTNSGNKVEGYKFRRLDYIWGKWLKHGESGSCRVTRLVRKNSGKWKRRVHPTFEVNGGLGEFDNPILHYPHQNLRKFITSINRWSTWHAMANEEEGKRSSLLKIILMPFGHFSVNYIFRLGFLDGIQGFVFAVVMSSHSFLAWSKLWFLQKGFSKI